MKPDSQETIFIIATCINLITHLPQVKDVIHLSRDKRGDNIHMYASFLVDFKAVMENLGIQPYTFGPVYSENEGVSD